MTEPQIRKDINLCSYYMNKEQLISFIKEIDKEVRFRFCHYDAAGRRLTIDNISNIFAEDQIPLEISSLELVFEDKFNGGNHSFIIRFGSGTAVCRLFSYTQEWISAYKTKIIKLLAPYNTNFYIFDKILFFLDTKLKWLWQFLLLAVVGRFFYLLKDFIQEKPNYYSPLLLILFGTIVFIFLRRKPSYEIMKSSPFCLFLTRPNQHFGFWKKNIGSFMAILWILGLLTSVFALGIKFALEIL